MPEQKYLTDVKFKQEIQEMQELQEIVNYLKAFKPEGMEQYEDADGILHFRTVINRASFAEDPSWEVFEAEDGYSPLEILYPIRKVGNIQ